MAEKKNKQENSVRLVGYLKEDNLEIIKNARGEQAIRGSIVVITDEQGLESHKVQFYVSETKKNGEHSTDFDNLSELLPEKAVSTASYLEDNPGASFEEAANASTKIWINARFEEYAYRVGERTDSMITVKGFKAGLKKATDKAPFKPEATFKVDVYIENIIKEVDEDMNETGRLVIDGIYLDYRGTAVKIPFVAPVEDGIASYIGDHYEKGTTVHLDGDLVSLVIRKVDENAETNHFGRGGTVQYKTTFVRERRIHGGSKTPLTEGEEGAYTKKAIVDGLSAREILMDENGKKRRERGSYAPSKPSPVVTKSFTTDTSDLDF